jgi:aminoglycoside phosphotransferase
MTACYYDPAFNPELRRVLEDSQSIASNRGDITRERLRASRRVYRFTFGGHSQAVVGKFFASYPQFTSKDRGLVNEYHAYLQAPAWGLTGMSSCLPRLMGCHPHVHLGLLLEYIPGPDLDQYVAGAAHAEGLRVLCDKLEKLAELLAFFHSRPRRSKPVSPRPALHYFHKLKRQLQAAGLVSQEELAAFRAEGSAWEALLSNYADYQVLVHGDATPTNFLFPDGRAVAVDLERLRVADRLFDLSWVAGELKHAWGWRFHDFSGSEAAISHFFRSYMDALPADGSLPQRLYRLNPFYMALAELRITRNAYLSWDYRRSLIEEALRCLSYGRRM